MVLDNGAFHHAKSLQIPKNIALIFLPPYSSELNPAESMWRHFKDKVSMIAYSNIKMLHDKITEISTELSSEMVTSICGYQFYLD